MKPREIIARTIHSFEDDLDAWEKLPEHYELYFLAIADEIIYKLRTMPVTEEMSQCAMNYWNCSQCSENRMSTADTWAIWRSMLEGMRE